MKTLIAILIALACAAPIFAEEEDAAPALLPFEEVSKRLVVGPKPEYPYEAMRSRIDGTGVVQVRVDETGQVTSAEMSQSTGSPILDNAATSAFRRWQFKPGSSFAFRSPITFTMPPLPSQPPPLAAQNVSLQRPTITARATPAPKPLRRVPAKTKPRVGDISNPEAETPPFVGMSKAQALARYGKPKRHTVTEEGEQWVYILNMGEMIGKAFIPFNFKPTIARTGVLTFGPDGTVRKFTWDTDKHD